MTCFSRCGGGRHSQTLLINRHYHVDVNGEMEDVFRRHDLDTTTILPLPLPLPAATATTPDWCRCRRDGGVAPPGNLQSVLREYGESVSRVMDQ